MDETIINRPPIFRIKIDSKKVEEIILLHLVREGMISDRERKHFTEVSHEPGASMVEFIVKI